MIKVENIETPKGNKAINQFYIYLKGRGVSLFQSYRTTIAAHDTKTKKIYINKDYYKYSRTTTKYYNIWINDYILPLVFASELEYIMLDDNQFQDIVLKLTT
jgi:hypothetical protein